MNTERFDQQKLETSQILRSPIAAARTALISLALAGCSPASQSETEAPADGITESAEGTTSASESVEPEGPERRLNIERESLEEKGLLDIKMVDGKLETAGHSDTELLTLSLSLEGLVRHYYHPKSDGLLEVGALAGQPFLALKIACAQSAGKCPSDREFMALIDSVYQRQTHSMIKRQIEFPAGEIKYDPEAPQDKQVLTCFHFGEYLQSEEGKKRITEVRTQMQALLAMIKNGAMAEMVAKMSGKDKKRLQRDMDSAMQGGGLKDKIEAFIKAIENMPNDLELCRFMEYDSKEGIYYPAFNEYYQLREALNASIMGISK